MFFSKEIFICLRALLVVALWGVLSLSAYAQSIAHLFDAKSQRMLSSVMSGQASASSGNTGKTTSSYKYRYDPKVSQNLFNQMVKVFAEESGMSEKEVTDNFKEVNLIEEISAALEAKGYAKHSLATAAAYWKVVNFSIAYRTLFTDKQDDAVFREMEQSMANEPAIGQLDDEQKQTLAELLIWLATLQMGISDTTKKDYGLSEAPEAAVQGARKSLAIFKINPDDYRLTPEGLVAK